MSGRKLAFPRRIESPTQHFAINLKQHRVPVLIIKILYCILQFFNIHFIIIKMPSKVRTISNCFIY